MTVFLGSKSEDKKKILEDFLTDLNIQDFDIRLCDVESGIDNQPLDELTTIQGAKNRARAAAVNLGPSDLGIGLEGGLTLINNNYNLVCVVVIRNAASQEFVGISDKLILPIELSESIKEGANFGDLIRSQEGAHYVGVTAHYYELLSREKSFKQAIARAFKESLI